MSETHGTMQETGRPAFSLPAGGEVRISLLLLGVTIPYTLAVWLTLDRFGKTPFGSWADYGRLVLVSWVIFLPLMGSIRAVNLAIHAPGRPLAEALGDFLRKPGTEAVLARATPLVMLTLLLGSFTAFKSVIPEIHPFAYDTLFMEIDRRLFLGTDPWQITHALFDSPFATWLLQQSYIMWFAIMWLSLAFVTWRTDLPRLRAHYLLAFALVWIFVGTLGGLVFSSAGPCFYEWAATGEPGVFAPLMDRLREQDTALRAMSPSLSLDALQHQEYLRRAMERGEIVLGGGISAMPSMHVAVATLIALAAGTWRRRLALPLFVMTGVIWIGSVHLAWHYAVDGILAFVLTLLIWRVSGAVVDRLLYNEITAP